MEAKNQMGALIIVFITIIIGLTLINVLGDEVYEVTNPETTLNESVDVTDLRNSTAPEGGAFTLGTYVSLINDNLESFTELRMANGTILTKDTDYTADLTNGRVTMLNTTATHDFQDSNTTLADYTHTRDGKYVQDSSIARTILKNLIIIFVILGLVLFVYGYIRKTMDI